MVPSIVASVICGKLCDRYGTKIVALVSLFLATPSCLLIGVPSNDHGSSFWPLVPILIMGGITIAGCQAPVFPEIAKVVDKENGGDINSSDGLARSYSLFNAAYGVGMCVGPLMAGYLYASIGFFWLCIILSTFFFCYIPFAYFYIGDNRHLINRPAAAVKSEQEERSAANEEETIDNETAVALTSVFIEESNLSAITVAVSDEIIEIKETK
jgi:MFS family permease